MPGKYLSVNYPSCGVGQEERMTEAEFISKHINQHYSIIHAAKQDYKGFYEEEILLREMMGYPPFGAFFSVLISGQDQGETAAAAESLGKILQEKNPEGRF